MRILIYLNLLFLFVFNTGYIYAQQAIREGTTFLATKEISLKGEKCQITPVVKFSMENPMELIVTVKLEWFDEKSVKIDNTDNKLYLIDNWDNCIYYFKDRKISIERTPQLQKKIEDSKAIEVFQDGQEIEIDKFKSGFSGFSEESAELKFRINYVALSEIRIKFNFVHITRKKKIKEAPFFKEWKFLLPEKSQIASVDCDKLEKQYKRLVQNATSVDLGHFERELKRKNINIDKLDKDFQDFKMNLKRAEGLKTTINYNKKLDECTGVKDQLLGQLEIFLEQNSEFEDVEIRILSLGDNMCSNFRDKYSKSLSKLKINKNLKYFKDQLDRSNTDIFNLDYEFSVFKGKLQDLKQLKEKVNSDPNAKKCSIEQKSIVRNIDKTLAENSDIRTIDNRIRAEMKKLSENKDLSFEKYRSKHENIYASLDEEYVAQEERLRELKKIIEARYTENAYRIRILKEAAVHKEDITGDSLNNLSLTFNLCETDNSVNLALTDSIILELEDMHARVEIKRQECRNDFIGVDKGTGEEKARILLDTFNFLLTDIEKSNDGFDFLKDEIKQNNKEISYLNRIFNPGKELLTRLIIEKYDSLFDINFNKIKKLYGDYKEIRIDFDESYYKNSYYKWVKGRFSDMTREVESELNLLQIEQDSLVASKEVEFEKNRIVQYMDNIQEFKKTEASLRPQLNLLIRDIDNWPHKSFPILYLIIGAIVLVILGFGGKVYINALRKKKKEHIVKINKETGASSGGGITIKKAPETKVAKGKGLDNARKKTGTDFFEIDLSYEWDDSAVSKVYFKRDCIIKTYRFFEDSLRTADTNTTAFETGGYMIGKWDYNIDNPKKYDVSLEEFIEPGNDAKFSQYQLNFGAKIGIKLQKVLTNFKEKAGSDYVMTAWFHSHPGLKIFLSDFDLSVQEGFSHDRETLKMIALVLDPYTKMWDTGIFTYKSDGSAMNNSKDSKRFFSLDRMYKWALDQQTEIIEHLYSIDLLPVYSESLCGRVYFKNPLILEIKRYLEDNKDNLEENTIAFIQGRQQIHDYQFSDIILDNLLEKEKPGEDLEGNHVNRIACLVGTDGDEAEVRGIIKGLEENNEHLLVLLLYNHTDQSLTVVSKNKNLVFNQPSPEAKIELAEMIDWTRKRK